MIVDNIFRLRERTESQRTTTAELRIFSQLTGFLWLIFRKNIFISLHEKHYHISTCIQRIRRKYPELFKAEPRDLAVCMFSEEALSWLLRCFFLEIMKPTPVTRETIKNRFFFIVLLLMSGTLLSYERMEAESAVWACRCRAILREINANKQITENRFEYCLPFSTIL